MSAYIVNSLRIDYTFYANSFILYFPENRLVSQTELVCNKGDKLRICRLALARIDRIAEK